MSVHDDTFLILNEQRTYGSNLHSVTPVTSFAVFFRPGMAAEVARCHALAPEVLLEHGHEPGPGVEFAEHSRRHDRLVTPVLRFIRHHAEAGLTDESWYEEQLYFLLQRMHALHRGELAAAALLPLRRPATRRELPAARVVHRFHARALRTPGAAADIAAAGHLSPYYCLRLFQALHRTTPTRYLAGVRARTAVRLRPRHPARRGDRGPCRLRQPRHALPAPQAPERPFAELSKATGRVAVRRAVRRVMRREAQCRSRPRTRAPSGSRSRRSRRR